MKFKKTKALALTLTAVIAGSALSGCAFVTTDRTLDLQQTVAEVNIADSEVFDKESEFKALAGNAKKLEKETITKYELQANFAGIGPTYISYGYTAEQVYDMIYSSLSNRHIFLQYAQLYFYENSARIYGEAKTPEGYAAAISSAAAEDKEIAGLRYLLGEEEALKVEYDLKVSINATLDSYETEVIEEQENHNHEHNHTEEATTSARTTPTGVDAEDEEFYDIAYKIYTGKNSASDCGSYETVDESTPTTRNKAYNNFIAHLNNYYLIEKGADTSKLENLKYYKNQRKDQYESAVITKLEECLEEDAKEKLTEEWIRSEKYEKTLATQEKTFGDSATGASAVESALDSVSDTNYVFYAPAGYGFVINILLPFSAAQSQRLTDSPADYDGKDGEDVYGNKFATRAGLLKNLTATDQRSAWFDADYAFEAEAGDKKFGEGDYLFFEKNLKQSSSESGKAQYTPLKNYLGFYSYNGEVLKTEDEDGDAEYAFKPNKLSIDGFLSEMKSYLEFNGLHLANEEYPFGDIESYTSRSWKSYYDAAKEGVVDYSNFLYYSAKIEELASFDPNKIFVNGTDGKSERSVENLAFSIMNELSFAYNTDTAGLNSYLGYAVSPNNTDFVKEFEYAAQKAVEGGPGTITVAPSDYGWHIMYCTFAYTGEEVYTFDWSEIETEGTFSNLYYEALKAENFSNFSTDRRTNIINSFSDCVTRFEDRYQKLVNV